MNLIIKISKKNNKSVIEVVFSEKISNKKLKSFFFDPEESDTSGIKTMFNFILENIENEMTFDCTDIDKNSESTIDKIALEYSNLLFKEIDEIREELKMKKIIE